MVPNDFKIKKTAVRLAGRASTVRPGHFAHLIDAVDFDLGR